MQIITRRGRLNNTLKALENEELTIGFTGGSITDARPEWNWPEPVIAWFLETFPRVRIRVENAAIGATGSDLAVFRAQKSLIDQGCDLVFIEYAVNDLEQPTWRRMRTREGLVRKLLKEGGRDLVFTYTFSQPMYADMVQDRMPETIKEFEQIASHYKIGSVWMGLHALQEVMKGQMRWEEWLPDGLHPQSRGTPQLETKRTPGYDTADYTGRLLNLYDIVQVFATEQVNNEAWYMIGPDEWLPGKFVARVLPNPVPPAGVTGDRWIEVNLFDQTLAVYDQRRLVFATLIASGAEPFWTRPGVFQIYEKHDTTPMTGAFEADKADAYYLEDVPWTMYFDKARALHGAYWRAKMGFEQSHGCVNLTVGDAHWLYDWGQMGDWVYVWDPSGKTPTDEAVYSAGGY